MAEREAPGGEREPCRASGAAPGRGVSHVAPVPGAGPGAAPSVPVVVQVSGA